MGLKHNNEPTSVVFSTNISFSFLVGFGFLLKRLSVRESGMAGSSTLVEVAIT